MHELDDEAVIRSYHLQSDCNASSLISVMVVLYYKGAHSYAW